MIKTLLIATVMVFAIGSLALAQNTNSSQTVRPRTTTSPSSMSKTGDPQKGTAVQQPSTTKPAVRHTETKPKVATTEAPGSQSDPVHDR